MTLQWVGDVALSTQRGLPQADSIGRWDLCGTSCATRT